MINITLDEVLTPEVGYRVHVWMNGAFVLKARDPSLGSIFRSLERQRKLKRTDTLQMWWKKRPETPCWGPGTQCGDLMGNYCEWVSPLHWVLQP